MTLTMECKNIDEKLLDFLYEELEQTEQEAFRAHLEGCARCQAEVNALGRVRQAARQITMVEPPSSVSAKILFQAAQHKPRGKVVPLFRRMMSHPAYAMAAAFVIVGGVAGWQLMVHGELKGAAPAVETAPASPPPTVAADPSPTAPTVPTTKAPAHNDEQAAVGAGEMQDSSDDLKKKAYEVSRKELMVAKPQPKAEEWRPGNGNGVGS